MLYNNNQIVTDNNPRTVFILHKSKNIIIFYLFQRDIMINIRMKRCELLLENNNKYLTDHKAAAIQHYGYIYLQMTTVTELILITRFIIAKTSVNTHTFHRGHVLLFSAFSLHFFFFFYNLCIEIEIL